MADVIYRCSDGHLYTANPLKAMVLSPFHLGAATQFQRCPVDHHWRMANRVNRNELTDEELNEASKYRL